MFEEKVLIEWRWSEVFLFFEIFLLQCFEKIQKKNTYVYMLQWRLMIPKVREEGLTLGCHFPACTVGVWWHKNVRLKLFQVFLVNYCTK